MFALAGLLAFQLQINLLWIIALQTFVAFSLTLALIWAMRLPPDSESETEASELEGG